MKTKWSKISLIFFLLVAIIGTLLRSVAYIPIPLKYLNLVHAHSHTAFQGWVYLIMMLLLTKTFLTDHQVEKGRYALQFKLTVFIVVGVLISFSLQGYGLYSIIFSTLFQLLNYWFVFRFLKDVKKGDFSEKYQFSLKFVKTGLWYGLLSTLLPYAIGISSAKGLNGTDTYNALVYSFLHLQYNGWFLFVVLGLFFYYMNKKNIPYNKGFANRFYWLFTIGVIPAVSLSFLGMDFSESINLIAYFSVLVLVLALVYFILMLPKHLASLIKESSVWFRLYFLGFLISFVVKTVLQCFSVFPFLKDYAFFNKPIIIAYLHLSLIGSISFLFLALLIEKKYLPLNVLVKTGSALLLIGFVITETVLVLMGFSLFYNQWILIIGSAAMALGVLFMIFSRTK
jgi:hypothetical protein